MRVTRFKTSDGSLGRIDGYLTSQSGVQEFNGELFIEGLSDQYVIWEGDLEGEELEAFMQSDIRPIRNHKLAESDAKWIELSSKGEDLTAINAYKQALRDFPQNVNLTGVNYLDEIVWPELG
jgi:hypothetical protein